MLGQCHGFYCDGEERHIATALASFSLSLIKRSILGNVSIGSNSSKNSSTH